MPKNVNNGHYGFIPAVKVPRKLLLCSVFIRNASQYLVWTNARLAVYIEYIFDACIHSLMRLYNVKHV